MDNKEHYYGKGGRLTKSANQKLIDTAYTHDANDSNELMGGLHVADIVHALALYEASLLPKDQAKELLKALIEISTEKIEIRPDLGDVYNSKEHALKLKIGDVSGWLHMGRARREAINNGFLLRFRSSVLEFYKQTITICESLSEVATANSGTLMTDFTYMLHAQPTSLGHYLGTYITPLTRDLERLESFYGRLNQSWAGVGSVNGSRLPIDREYLSTLFGCEKPAMHLRDAMWMPDIFNEGIFLLNNVLGGLTRFVQELIVWNTHEFGYIEIDDSFARASVIMPQKKNPYPLAYLRGLSNEMMGKLSSYMMIGKETSGFPDNRIFIYGDIIRSYDKVSKALDMFSDFVKTITWNKGRMSKAVLNSFAYATDLAECLSKHTVIDYKSSHKIVGKSIRAIRGNNSLEIIHLIMQELRSKNINLTKEGENELKDSTDIQKLAQSRMGLGGSSFESLKVYFETIDSIIKKHKGQLHTKEQAIDQIESKINKQLKKIDNEFPVFRSTIKA